MWVAGGGVVVVRGDHELGSWYHTYLAEELLRVGGGGGDHELGIWHCTHLMDRTVWAGEGGGIGGRGIETESQSCTLLIFCMGSGVGVWTRILMVRYPPHGWAAGRGCWTGQAHAPGSSWHWPRWHTPTGRAETHQVNDLTNHKAQLWCLTCSTYPTVLEHQCNVFLLQFVKSTFMIPTDSTIHLLDPVLKHC